MTTYQFFYGEQSINHRLFMVLNHAANPFFDWLMPLATTVGDSIMIYEYFLVLLILSLISRTLMPRRYLIVYPAAFLLSFAMEGLLKVYFHVPRPAAAIGVEHVRVLGELKLHNSLPSGHAIFAFTTALALSYGRNIYWKVLFFSAAVLIAYSRIYVGAHYPLDVLTGALVGMGSAFLVWKLYERIEPLFGSLNGQKGEKAVAKEEHADSTQN